MSKEKEQSTEITFARPVFSKELLTEDAQKRFDSLDAWKRHLIKRVIDHGDLQRAVVEAGVSNKTLKIDETRIDRETVVDQLHKGGLTPHCLVAH